MAVRITCDGCHKGISSPDRYLVLSPKGLMTLRDDPSDRHFHDYTCLKVWLVAKK